MLPAIRIENLGKRYRLGETHAQSVRELVNSAAARLFARSSSTGRSNKGRINSVPQEEDVRDFWALKEVSFEIQPGEVVGVIGRNGAGKSTLLKILSNIVAPTTGRIELRGRVSSLLEVGTGFHPELTGRENIYLNGSILGMSQKVIRRRFEEIVEFAEVDHFIDTPVKRYSSGMYIRLAFAVAAHLESEILIVDEVLAVGDAPFQRKCLEQMQRVTGAGRTVLFVSHNMSAIRSVCSRGLVLEQGAVAYYGTIESAIQEYEQPLDDTQSDLFPQVAGRFHLAKASVRSATGNLPESLQPATITVCFSSESTIEDLGCYVGIHTSSGIRLAGLNMKDFATVRHVPAGQMQSVTFQLKSLPLMPGDYFLEVHAQDMESCTIEIFPRHIPFRVPESSVYGTRKLNQWFGVVPIAVDLVLAENCPSSDLAD